MKAVLSEEYYRKYWDFYLEKVPGEDYRNLEQELEDAMAAYKGVELDDEAFVAIRKYEAEKIAASCKVLVVKEMELIKSIEAGKASFGFTTRQQEYSKRAEYRKRFEFNCLQLSDFRGKYL